MKIREWTDKASLWPAVVTATAALLAAADPGPAGGGGRDDRCRPGAAGPHQREGLAPLTRSGWQLAPPWCWRPYRSGGGCLRCTAGSHHRRPPPSATGRVGRRHPLWGEAAAPRVGDPTRSRDPKTTSPCIGRKKRGGSCTALQPADQLIEEGRSFLRGVLTGSPLRQVRCQFRQSSFSTTSQLSAPPKKKGGGGGKKAPG